MKKLLKNISEKAIELADFEFTKEQIAKKWLGKEPTLETEVKLAEKRLGIELPSDYKRFLSITNGFSAPNDIEPTFEDIDKIDYLKNSIPDVIEFYDIPELENCILIGGINEEQHFFIIPPTIVTNQWKYWKFANWYPGEQEHESLESYFKSVLEFMESNQV